MALLTLEDLHLSFGGVAALAGVSLEVDAGDFFAIIGPNGAGKTSIFNCISGIYRPNRGRILFDGQDITPSGPIGARCCGSRAPSRTSPSSRA